MLRWFHPLYCVRERAAVQRASKQEHNIQQLLFSGRDKQGTLLLAEETTLIKNYFFFLLDSHQELHECNQSFPRVKHFLGVNKWAVRVFRYLKATS